MTINYKSIASAENSSFFFYLNDFCLVCRSVSFVLATFSNLKRLLQCTSGFTMLFVSIRINLKKTCGLSVKLHAADVLCVSVNMRRY